MRIISQDGTIDLEYNQCGMVMAEELPKGCCSNTPSGYTIKAHYYVGQGFMRMAFYSTKEKAYKAMESLRETYSALMALPYRKDLGKEDKCRLFMENSFWQFPKDDE